MGCCGVIASGRFVKRGFLWFDRVAVSGSICFSRPTVSRSIMVPSLLFCRFEYHVFSQSRTHAQLEALPPFTLHIISVDP